MVVVVLNAFVILWCAADLADLLGFRKVNKKQKAAGLSPEDLQRLLQAQMQQQSSSS